jgi:phosphoribosylanthranilate isomerase
MKVKVCGLKNEKNIIELVRLGVDYLGFIFYEKSPRFIGKNNHTLSDFLKKIPLQKVGVFVDATEDFVLEQIQSYELNFVQLHSKESPHYCRNLQIKLVELGLEAKIIKVFSVGEGFDFSDCEAFMTCTDYFLFDTKGENLGGKGVAFDWNILQNYQLGKPFFLSGGIDLQHAPILKNLQNPALYALDINSHFEIEVGLKDSKKIREFIVSLQ